MSKDLYHVRAKKLKAAGLIDIDLRLKLTPAQKGAITKKYDKYRDVVNHPENYQRISVSNKTAKTADWDIFRKKTKARTTLIVPIEKDSSARMSTARVNGKILPILIVDHPQYVERVYPGGYEFFNVAEKVFKDSDEGDPTKFITARIGENSHFRRNKFDTRLGLMLYLREWEPKDFTQRHRKHELIKHFSVVTLKYHRNRWEETTGDIDAPDDDYIPKKRRQIKGGKKNKGGTSTRRNRR